MLFALGFVIFELVGAHRFLLGSLHFSMSLLWQRPFSLSLSLVHSSFTPGGPLRSPSLLFPLSFPSSALVPFLPRSPSLSFIPFFQLSLSPLLPFLCPSCECKKHTVLINCYNFMCTIEIPPPILAFQVFSQSVELDNPT